MSAASDAPTTGDDPASPRAGDRPGAIGDLERFLELAPEDRDAGGARARLEELREAEKKIRP